MGNVSSVASGDAEQTPALENTTAPPTARDRGRRSRQPGGPANDPSIDFLPIAHIRPIHPYTYLVTTCLSFVCQSRRQLMERILHQFYTIPLTPPKHNIVSLYIATKMIQKHAPHPCAILSTGGGGAKTETDAGFLPSTVQKINMLACSFVKVFLPSSDCSLV